MYTASHVLWVPETRVGQKEMKKKQVVNRKARVKRAKCILMERYQLGSNSEEPQCVYFVQLWSRGIGQGMQLASVRGAYK